MKKHLSHLIISFLLTCGALNAQDAPYSLLWEISGNGLTNPSYLFGTMHVRNPRVFNLGDSVYYAIKRSPAFALEIDMDSLQLYLCKAISSKDRDTSQFDDVIIKKKPKRIPGERKFQIKDTAEIFIPQNFLDMYLFRIAQQENKKIYGLEPYRNQIDEVGERGSWSQEEEIYMYSFINDMTVLYEKGDLDAIEEELEGAIEDSLLLIKRNYDMLNSIIHRAHETGIFAAVGAAHLYGESGLVTLLRSKGYDVRRMDRGEIRKPVKFGDEVDTSKWVKFIDPANRFTMKIPGEVCSGTTFEGVNFNLYLDPYTNQTFVIGSGLPDISLDEKSIFNHVIKNIGGKGFDAKKISPVRLRTEDGTAVQIRIFDDEYDLEYRYFYHGGFLYYFFHAQYALNSNPHTRDLFFNSLEFNDLEKNETYISDSLGAFAVSFPGMPLPQTMDLSDTDVGPFKKLNQWAYADATEKTQYLLQYIDFLGEETFLNEREVIDQMILGVVESYGKAPLLHDTFQINGYPAQRDVYQLDDKTYMTIQIAIRGNRLYMQLKTSIDEIKRFDDFFTSLVFLPFEEKELKVVNVNDGEFSILAPSAVTEITDTLNYGYQYSPHTWSSFQFQNENNSSQVVVKKAELSPYFEYVWSDSLFQKFNELFTNEEKYTEQNDSLSGYPSHRIIIRSSTGSTRTIEYFISGDILYAIDVIEPRELDTLDHAEKLIRSFKLLKHTPKTVEGKGSTLLLSDLLSENSQKHEKAINAISTAHFKPYDLPLMEEILMKEWPDDSLVLGIRSLLIERYIEMQSPNTMTVLSKMVSAPVSKPEYMTSVLKSLIALNTAESHALADSLIDVYTGNDIINTYTLLRDYRDSVELFRAHFPFFIKHLDHPDFHYQIKNMLLTNLRDTAFAVQTFADELREELWPVFEETVAELLKNKQKNVVFSAAQKISDQLEILNAIGRFKDIQPYFKDLLAKNQLHLSSTIILISMQNNVAFDQKILISILNDKDIAHAFVFKAYNQEVFDKIPKELYNEMKIAESDVRYYVYDELYPDEIIFREKRHWPEVNSGSYYYVFELTFKKDPEKMLAISGPYPLEKPYNYTNKGTTYSYETFKESNYENILKELLEENVED